MAYKISSDCVACGTCIDECPVGAIHEGDHVRACARVAQSASNEVCFLTKNVHF